MITFKSDLDWLVVIARGYSKKKKRSTERSSSTAVRLLQVEGPVVKS